MMDNLEGIWKEARFCLHWGTTTQTIWLEELVNTYDKRGSVFIEVRWRLIRVYVDTVEKQYVLHILSVCIRNVALVKLMHRIVICGLPRSIIFFHIIS